NAAWIEASPKVQTLTATVPDPVLALLAQRAQGADKGVLPPQAEQWLDQQLHIQIRGRTAEFSPDEVYVGLPEPGADAWLAINLADGEVEYERSNRGVIAYLNDLHK